MTTSQGGYVDGGFDLLKAPDAPTITSVTNGIGTMSVAFTAPANPGGSAVTGYTVTAINESTGASVGATGSASPITVATGAGTFRVRSAATNIYGPGRVSAFNTGNVVFSGASLWSWGENSVGAVGDGTVINRSSPVQIGALTTWGFVSSSRATKTALRADGTLWAWGQNAFGALGQNNTINRSSPVQIGALTNWSKSSASVNHVVATKSDGTLWSWGNNSSGELGDGTTVNKSSPVQVGALTNWAQVSAVSGVTAAITTTSQLWTWGSGSYGRLGQNSTVSRSSPVQIGALTNWAQVSVGESTGAQHAVKTDGTLWGWGRYIGDGTATFRSSPVQIGTLADWAQVSCGASGEHTSAIKTDGTLWSWGINTFGQLGDGTTSNRLSPVQIGILTNWSQISTSGLADVFAVKTDGTLWAWGRGTDGDLGDNTNANKSSPVQVGALTSWYLVSNTLALYGVT
jgi:hypothetical protein